MDAAELGALFRRLLRGSEHAQAEARVRDDVKRASTSARVAEAQASMRTLAAGGRAVVLGAMEDGTPLHVSQDLALRHLLATGRSGSGKSYALLVLIDALLDRALRGEVGLIVKDPKGEVGDLVLRLVAARVARMPRGERARALALVRVVDPFGIERLPPLNALCVPPGVEPAVYVRQFATSFALATSSLGVRQQSVLQWALRLALETKLPLPLLPRVLGNGFLLDALVREASAETRGYFAGRFTGEGTETRGGLLARLEDFFALASTRRAFAAEGAVDFGPALDGGVTIVSLGNAPHGCRSVQKFWSLLLTTRLLHAVFARKNDPTLPPAVVLADELQELVLPEVAEDLERILALARARRVALWATVQEVGQLADVSPLLARVMLTNVATWVAFCAGPHDARFLRAMLRPEGRRPRPRGAPWEPAPSKFFLSRSEEEALLLEEACALPSREAYFWDRTSGTGAVRFRTRELVLPTEAEIPAEILEAVQRGAVAVPVAELDCRLEVERTRLDGLLRPTAAPRARARAPEPDEQQPEPAPSPRRRRAKGALPDMG